MNAILVTGYIGTLSLLAALRAGGGADGGCARLIHPTKPALL